MGFSMERLVPDIVLGGDSQKGSGEAAGDLEGQPS